ncbi:hypothetical protein [Mycolicibacterium mageritense]|uniref:hypothetical protein n=1 Tax=Mycolicibacterium mageritense TaxID=53462 RepID=UPI0011D674E3|nr:hypothetical protein [Mycolicibacterium mageritense]TXI63397.1 MAG: hypothetical protein E6Q55_09550 [Mycolicibacterium mageritense]
MTVLQLLTEFALPVAGALSLATGLLSWQRSQRFWSGQLKPRRWETFTILIGAALMAWYVAVQIEGPGRFVTIAMLLGSAAAVAWLALRGRGHANGSDSRR